MCPLSPWTIFSDPQVMHPKSPSFMGAFNELDIFIELHSFWRLVIS